jgi:hypothetical protein
LRRKNRILDFLACGGGVLIMTGFTPSPYGPNRLDNLAHAPSPVSARSVSAQKIYAKALPFCRRRHHRIDAERVHHPQQEREHLVLSSTPPPLPRAAKTNLTRRCRRRRPARRSITPAQRSLSSGLAEGRAVCGLLFVHDASRRGAEPPRGGRFAVAPRRRGMPARRGSAPLTGDG